MKTLSVVQGTAEWLAVRAQYNTASEAPVMMGASRFMSREELLRQKKTGYVADVDNHKQRLFDRGHAAEAAARSIVEEMIGEDLYPVTGVEGALLASFDGVDLGETVGFEHKLWSESLAAKVRSRELDPMYYWQLEQQILVGGLEKVIFVCSDGTRDNFVHMEYRAVPGRAEQLIAAWKQFAEDMANYVPPELPAAKIVAEPVEALPAPVVQVTGQLALQDNFKVFEDRLRDFLAHRLIREPKTDEDFVNLDAQIKAMKAGREALKSAKAQMLAQVQPIDQAGKTADMLDSLLQQNCKLAEDWLKNEKERRRDQIVAAGVKAFADHIAALNKRIGRPYMPAIPVDFGGCVKGLKSLSSMEEKVGTHLANAKIAANDVADKISLNMATLRELAADHVTLFPDTAQLVLKGNDDLTALVKTRIAEHEKAETDRLERQRAQIAEEERVKAEAKVRAEAEDALIASIWANARRIEGDSVAYINKAIDHFESGAGAYGHDKRPRVTAAVKAAREELVGKLTAAEARESARATATPPPPPPQDQPVAEAKPTIFEELASTPAYQATRVADAQATATPHPPTMNLGKISAVLGFTVTAAFLQQIGCHPAKTERASFLYHDRDILTILEALGAHLQAVYSAQKAKYQPARTRTAA